MGWIKGKGDAGGKKEGDAGGKKEGEAGGKEGSNPASVVLQVDLHCEDCAKKVRLSISRFEGVESVATDDNHSKLFVMGKMDPGRLREWVERKTHKPVLLISPFQPPKESIKPEQKPNNKKSEEKSKEVKQAEKMPKEEENKALKKPKEEDKEAEEKPKLVRSTVVLRIALHCEGCIKKIWKMVFKIRGVEEVSIDAQKNEVMVKGTMDPEQLPCYLQGKFRRHVEIVHLIKQEEKSDKKKPSGDDGEKGGKGGGAMNKKEGDGAKEKKIGKTVETRDLNSIDAPEAKSEVRKMEYSSSGSSATHFYNSSEAMPSYHTSTGSSYTNMQHHGEPMPYYVHSSNTNMHHQGEAMPYYVNNGNTNMHYAQVPYYASSSNENMQYQGAASGQYPTASYAPYQIPAQQMFSDENPNACSIM